MNGKTSYINEEEEEIKKLMKDNLLYQSPKFKVKPL